MDKIELQKNELEILQSCLIYFKDNSTIQKVSEMAGYYQEKIEKIINGEVVQFSSQDFWNLHSYVITIFAGILNKKGKVAKGKWADKYWDSVLLTIEECYSKDDIYEVLKVSKMKK